MGRPYRRRRRQVAATRSCGSSCSTDMSDDQGAKDAVVQRASRMARYKEERRAQLAQQFNESTYRLMNNSQSEGPRMTRAARLRLAAANGAEVLSAPATPADSPRSKPEKDKSAKRKSNLNRSLVAEEVPLDTSGDFKGRRRRRRFFPPEVLDRPQTSPAPRHSLSSSSSSSTTVSTPQLSQQSLNATKKDSVTNPTASTTMSSSSSPITASSSKSPRKSELSIHMENARKGVTSRNSIDAGRKKDVGVGKRASNSLEKLNGSRASPRKTDDDSCSGRKVPSKVGKSRISRRMDELTQLTRETLARVEVLASKTTATSKKVVSKKKAEDVVLPVSILKRKVSQEESKLSVSVQTPPVTFSPSVVEPTSRRQGILKKHRSLDESQVLRHRSCSPDVASKSDAKSILKTQRRSSLEEIPRLSDSTNIQGILKRRTSRCDEELDNSLNSPQSILKRRSGASSAGSSSGTHHHVSITTAVILAAAEGAEMILDNNNETVRPILKKKSISEEGSNGDNDNLKPILKKKSSTDTDEGEEKPKRPILKMSRSDEARHSANESGSECEVKPILKSSSREETPRPRLSFCASDDDSARHRLSFCASDDETPRPPLSTPSEEEMGARRRPTRRLTDFQSLPGSSGGAKEEDRSATRPRVISVADLVMNFEGVTGAVPKKSSIKRNCDRYRTQPITFNEFEASLHYVHSPQLEEFPRLALSSPVTSNSHNNAHSLLDLSLSLSLNGNDHLNSYFSNSMPKKADSNSTNKMSSDSAFQSLGDGLELEQEEQLSPSPSPTMVTAATTTTPVVPAAAAAAATTGTTKKSGKAEPSNLELQMRAIAQEAKAARLNKVNAGIQKYRNKNNTESTNRFSTQPITLDEVQKAAAIKADEENSSDAGSMVEEADPSNLSLSERIKLFAKRGSDAQKTELRVPRRPARLATQPVTFDEVEKARGLNEEEADSRRRLITALGNEASAFADARKGILRIKSREKSRSPPPKSNLRNIGIDYTNARSLLKSKVDQDDEGISSNDSDTDSDVKIVITGSDVEVENLSDNSSVGCLRNGHRSMSSKSGSDQTTSDESSGGREIQSIIGRDVRRRRERSNEGNIAKSKSQTNVGNDKEVHQHRPATVRRSVTMPRATIGELKAKLQQSGDNDWKKRLPKLNNANEELNFLNVKNLYNDQLSEKTSILEAKKDELDASARQWKNRVEKSDANQISVAGRMCIKDVPTVPINIPLVEKGRTPKPNRFKGREDSNKDSSSTPVSPDLDTSLGFKRSISVPTSNSDDSSGSDTSLRASGRRVSIIKPDDDTFKAFFKSVDTLRTSEHIDINLNDFDLISRHSLLATKKNIQVQKRKATSKNPIKALAARSDIQTEYIEITTGFAERELKVKRLVGNTNFATEALAGLASKEDFSSVVLKKAGGAVQGYLPYKDVMLLQVKGRRHVQTRLVEPTALSVNEGDCFVLVTPGGLFNYIGAYSNIIEQSRAADVINHIQQSNDLGCKIEKVVTIDGRCSAKNKDVQGFWNALGGNEQGAFGAGNPDEDEVYESMIVNTNMIYTVENKELVPYEDYWGKIPKIEMLNPAKVLVFDFGSEMYIWSGKNADADEKRCALKLAKELWEHGYNYSDCSVCPLTIAEVLGDRGDAVQKEASLKCEERPKWALFAKISQHTETILFREKFLDWPDYTRVIKIKNNQNKTQEATFDLQPFNVSTFNEPNSEPDLIVENTHLGRGRLYFDPDTRMNYEVVTLGVTTWIIYENTYEKLDGNGHFYDGETYIIKWQFRVNVTARELSGKPSKHAQVGRDRCIYFYWLGKNSSTNDKGLAALLTVELDVECARQVRVNQGLEPPAFLQLFNGKMFVHSGKRDVAPPQTRLYITRGEIEHESFLTEISCSMRSLRSRSSFVLLNDSITIWHGCKSLPQTRKIARGAADHITKDISSDFCLSKDAKVKVLEEGSEDEAFMELLGEKRQLYSSLLKAGEGYKGSPRMFCFSSLSGELEAQEVLCPHRNGDGYTTPYPFIQSELYSAKQPALFLFDNGHELWLWQGWWPENENLVESSEQTGSGAVRWQAERRAAMQTAVEYWHSRNTKEKSVPAYLVWAGLEPLSFTNLFPVWHDRDDIAELNIKEGRKAGDMILIEKELAQLTRTTYPLAELLQRPLPDGVDPTHLEKYLSPEDFAALLSLTVEEFQKLPSWKQTALKKEKGLF